MANTLTLSGAAFDTSGQKFGSGALNGGYGNVSGGVLITATPFAVGVWFKTATTPTATQVITGQNQVFWIGYNANGTLHFEFGGYNSTSAKAVNTASAPSTGVWHFATLSCSSTTMTATLDGAVVGTASLSGAAASFTATGNDPSGKPYGVFAARTHGGYETSYLFANGEIDELAVWAADQYNAAFIVPSAAYTGAETSLVSLYHFDGNGNDSKAASVSTYALSGPATGSVGVASSAFTASVSGALTSAVVVTPSDGGAGGTFTPATVTLPASANPTVSFTYTAVQTGAIVIAGTNSGGLTNPSSLTFTASAIAASTYTLSGPSSGVLGAVSPAFTVTAVNSLAAAVTVTPSDSGAGGTFAPSSVSLPAGLNKSATFTYLPSGAGTKTISTANGGGLTNPSAISFMVTSGQTFAPNNAAIVHSPGNWLVGSSSAKTINAGAYFQTLFTGSTAILTFDLSANSTPLPQIWYRVDGVGWNQAPLASSVGIAIPTSTAAWPRHHLEVVVKSTSEFLNIAGSSGGSRWSPQNTAVVLTSVVLASGQTLAAPNTLGQSILVYGDSIVEGYHSVANIGSAAQDTDGSDASVAWAYRQREVLGAEVGVIGFGGAGLTQVGQLGVPALLGSYNYLWSGQIRSFSPAPDLIIIAYGENDGTSVGDATFIANYKSVLTGLLSATPYATQIVCMVPLSGKKAADIQTAVNQVASARVRAITPAGLFTAADSLDGVHPLGAVHIGVIAPALANLLRPVLQGVRNPWVRK